LIDQWYKPAQKQSAKAHFCDGGKNEYGEVSTGLCTFLAAKRSVNRSTSGPSLYCYHMVRCLCSFCTFAEASKWRAALFLLTLFKMLMALAGAVQHIARMLVCCGCGCGCFSFRLPDAISHRNATRRRRSHAVILSKESVVFAPSSQCIVLY